jgi:Na+-transporting NADH:ubiquinone oxidoreductase subunit NqrC
LNKTKNKLYIFKDAPNVFAGQPEVVKGSDRSAHITCEVDAVPPAQVSCVGVTKDFIKPRFCGFFLCAGIVDFLHMFWCHF